MKKIIKLSILASLVLSSSLYANTLEEALKSSKVKAEIKAQYFNTESVADSKNDSILAIGGNLNLITGSYYGFNAGVTFQTSHIVDKNINNTNDFENTMDASGSVMSESYLQYQFSNTSLKVGRQYISTPLIKGSDTRMIKQSFEGVTLVNKDIPDTTISLTYIDKYQDRTDGSGNTGRFIDYENGAFGIYIENKSIEKLDLKAQYLNVDGETNATDKDVTYLEAGYDFGFMNIKTQYIDSSNGDEDGSLFGLKASTKIGMFNLIGIYSITGSEGTVYPGIGSGSDPVFTALPLHGGDPTYTKDTDATVGLVITNIYGVTVGAYYGVVKTDDESLPYNKLKGTGAFAQYAFNKNLLAKVMYERIDFDTFENDDNLFRSYLSYKF